MRKLTKIVSTPASLPAPVGGWNARDSLGEMPPLDAVYLTNMFPKTTEVMLRRGYTEHATGLPDQVETLMEYAGASADKLFAISDGKIYDVSSAGAVGAPAVSSLTNSRWQYVNVGTTANNYLMLVNGVDKARFYTGSAWAKDGDGAPYDITGVDSADCIQINMFKNRVWLVEDGTLNAWYLPTGQIGGSATKFPLNGVASMGGYLMAMATWTIDAGQGMDDYAVFVTSKGQLIMYKGTDPSSVNTFALVGVWVLGAPVGRRCFINLGGDVLLICQDGVLPISGILQSSRVNPRVALTDKIQWAMSEAISTYGSNFGWQLLYYPESNILFLNVPVDSGMQQQYAMNTISKAWCNFTGWHANCWSLFNDQPYFGGDGFVGHAWNGSTDAGDDIQGDGKQAFNYFKMPGVLKRWTMMRPILSTNGTPAVQANVNVDFDDTPPSAPISFSSVSYGLWDAGLWDAATWGSDDVIQKNWQGVTGLGYCASVRILINAQGINVNWISTDTVFEKGAIL